MWCCARCHISLTRHRPLASTWGRRAFLGASILEDGMKLARLRHELVELRVELLSELVFVACGARPPIGSTGDAVRPPPSPPPPFLAND